MIKWKITIENGRAVARSDHIELIWIEAEQKWRDNKQVKSHWQKRRFNDLDEAERLHKSLSLIHESFLEKRTSRGSTD